MSLASILSRCTPRCLAVPTLVWTLQRPVEYALPVAREMSLFIVPFINLYVCESVISGFMTGEARNGQPPPYAVRHRGRTPPLPAARPAPPCCSLSPLPLICLPWLTIITVQETGKEGKMQRSLAAPLWVSSALGKESTWRGSTDRGGGRPCRCVVGICCCLWRGEGPSSCWRREGCSCL